MSSTPLSTASIRSLNAKIRSSPLGNVDFCPLQASVTGSSLTIDKKTLKSGSEELVVGVLDGKGEMVYDFARNKTAPLIKFRTPISHITGAYSFPPKLLAKWFDPTAAHDITACLQLSPAGDPAEWHEIMDEIGPKLARKFANAVREHGTCIPGDEKTNKRLQKKKESLKTEEKFSQWFETDMLGGDGTPHMSHYKGRILDPENAGFTFRSNLFKGAEKMTSSVYDDLLDGKLEEMREKVGKPCRFAPVPIYWHNKMVGPDEYDEVARRLKGSLAYAVIWIKLFANAKNRVLSLKCGIDKVVIAQLGDASGGGSDAVVNVAMDAEVEEEEGSKDVLNIFADVSQDDDGAPSAKRVKTSE